MRAIHLAMPVLSGLLLASSSLAQQTINAAGACSQTTAAAAAGCAADATSKYSYSLGGCENETPSSAVGDCRARAAKAFSAANALCLDQANARSAVCDAIGQAPYDPQIVPAEFSANVTNPLFPLRPGSRWIYRNGDAAVTVDVLARTRRIAGVDCRVVHDVNRVSGEVEEDTFDYYAQRNDGNVWYFGEDTIAYDNGMADTTGSWRTGVDGAKPGVIMFAHPPIGTAYRQEFRLGSAEDMARALAGNQHVQVPFGSFNNAMKTREFTALEPGGVEMKYYVPGIGNVLTVNPDTGEREALVKFTPEP